MYNVVILRDQFFGDDASLGVCLVYNNEGVQIFKSESLERGWKNNQKNVSCIPVGKYPLRLDYSPRFRKDLWEVYDVPNRSECKFHAANYWKQLNGCMALGNNRKHIDGDLILDVTSSGPTMSNFHQALTGQKEAILHVFDVPSLLIKSI